MGIPNMLPTCCSSIALSLYRHAFKNTTYYGHHQNVFNNKLKTTLSVELHQGHFAHTHIPKSDILPVPRPY